MKQQIIFFLILFSCPVAQENRLFWDGGDWNRVAKSVNYNDQVTFKMKTAYLHGALDGRLYGY